MRGTETARKSSVLPPEWKIQHDIGKGEKFALEIIGDLLGHGTIGPAGKAPVEIALVDRRCPRACQERGIVSSPER